MDIHIGDQYIYPDGEATIMFTYSGKNNQGYHTFKAMDSIGDESEVEMTSLECKEFTYLAIKINTKSGTPLFGDMQFDMGDTKSGISIDRLSSQSEVEDLLEEIEEFFS